MDPNMEEAERTAEHFESIPWAALAQASPNRARRAAWIAVMVAVGAVLGFLGGQIIRRATASGVVVTLPPVAAASPVAVPVPVEPPVDAPAEPAAVLPTTTVLVESSISPLPQLYSEADLMAVLPEEEMRLAVMRAEWFVTDYFTVDGESAAGGDVLDALPEALGDAPLPHQADGGGVSYVEWAGAYLLEPLGPATYRVAVAFRTLAGPSGSLVRSEVRAVTVDVAVSSDGSVAVLDFPAPVEAPGTFEPELVLPPGAEAPAEVLAGASADAGFFGSDPALYTSGFDDTGWRVVMLVGDRSGYRWPVVARR